MVDALNKSECEFYLDDSDSFLMHHFEKEWKSAEARIQELEKEVETFKDAYVEKNNAYINACQTIADLQVKYGEVMSELNKYKSVKID